MRSQERLLRQMQLEDVVVRRPIALDAAGRCGRKKVCRVRCRWKMRSQEGIFRQMPLEDVVARRPVASDAAGRCGRKKACCVRCCWKMW